MVGVFKCEGFEYVVVMLLAFDVKLYYFAFKRIFEDFIVEGFCEMLSVCGFWFYIVD